MKMTLAIFVLVAFISTGTFAQADQAPGSSTAKPARFIDKVTLGYLGIYYGPGIGQPDIYQPDVATGDLDTTSPLTAEHAFGLGYKITPNDTLSINQWINTPIRGSIAAYDPYLRWNRSKVFSAGNYSMGADLRAYIPLSTKSINKKLITGFRSTQSHSLEIPGSRWSAGGNSFVRYDFRSSDGSGSDFSFDLNPSINYKINDIITASFSFDYCAGHKFGTDWSFSNFSQAYPMNFGVGVDWTINSKFTLSPGLAIYPDNVSLSTTQLIVVAVASLL